ncbi:hypothetical protein EJ04DRAFT_521006 [Polyplosphaeria fusca]|uniref:Uncharacterized protein n=1 Tax=Polyplosphaeria fusca TaxID=682080 RepID=A0A9P4R2X4_9PLEO|nr:hypothetical protein EJ04DRAFT_521006 [Polyplosphaeria fusca]
MSSGSRNPNCGSCCILFMGISGKVGLFASLAGTVLAKAKERSDALHAIPQLQGPPYPAHFLQSPNITQWSCLAGILWSFVGPVIASVFWCSGKKDTGLAICFGGDFLPALALVVALIWEAESLPANCKHAADWEYNPTPTIFTLLVGSSNGTAAAKCNGFKSDRKTTIGLTVIWGVLVKPVQVGMGLTGFVKDGLTTSRDIRHREKLIMERPYRRPMSMQMKTFRTVTELSPPDEALMEQGNPKLIRIFSLQSPNRSTPLMAQYLHFSDIVALAGTSKTLRYMLNRDLSLQEIRRYTCVSGTKRECWVCSAQICLIPLQRSTWTTVFACVNFVISGVVVECLCGLWPRREGEEIFLGVTVLQGRHPFPRGDSFAPTAQY